MLELDELKIRLNALDEPLKQLYSALNIKACGAELAKLEKETESDGFWSDLENSQKVLKQIKKLKSKLEEYGSIERLLDDARTLYEMAEEEQEPELAGEIRDLITKIEDEIEKARLSTLLTGEYDGNNAILSFHAGAGGTEAQDWAEMLYRMYTRWAERHGFTYKILDYLDGDEAGLKSASILIEGENAFGYLKSEAGVHRLVRISPFDASGRRHTSFAAIEVMRK